MTGAVIGLDGGGTATRVAVADGQGRELLRRTGPPGLVDPRRPAATVTALIHLVRDAAAEADTPLPVAGLCAGLAGVGAPRVRDRLREGLVAAGVARQLLVVPDGEVALEGALAGEPGILLVAGTGSSAWGRGEDGRIARCGGWGMWVGDEGSGYGIGRAGLQAALQAADGRGEETHLLPELLSALDLTDPLDVPPWVGRAEKGAIAALAPVVIRLAEADDLVADRIVATAAAHLARHVEALVERLAPWSTPVPTVFHGGLLGDPGMAERVESSLRSRSVPARRREPAADALTGAVRLARGLRAGSRPV